MSQWDLNSDLIKYKRVKEGERKGVKGGNRGGNKGGDRGDKRQGGDRRGRGGGRRRGVRGRRKREREKKSCMLFADLFKLQILCLPDSKT